MAEPPPPSPPWYGAISTVLMIVMIVVLLTYTLLDWDWQQSFGAWNYAVAGVTIVATAVLMKNWRADLSRNDGAVTAHRAEKAREDRAGAARAGDDRSP